MAKQIAGKAKPNTFLWYIGLWATIWWAISGIFIVTLLWQSKSNYIIDAGLRSSGNFSTWIKAIKQTYINSDLLQISLICILGAWVIGGCIWLRALRLRKISYSAGLRDLFLTIRK